MHRKLHLLLPFVLFLFCQPLQAQKIGAGINAGFNVSSHLNNFRFATQDIQLDFKPSFSFGYNFGLMYRHILSKNWRIQAEPTFILLGAEYDDTFTLRGFEFRSVSKTELSYLQLPLVVHWTTTPPDLAEFPRPWPETTYHVTGGIYGGYLLDATFSGRNIGEPIGINFEGEFSNNVSDQYNNFDAGVIVGVGFEYGLDTKFGVELRGMMGVLKSGNASELNFSTQNLAFTTTIYFLL